MLLQSNQIKVLMQWQCQQVNVTQATDPDSRAINDPFHRQLRKVLQVSV